MYGQTSLITQPSSSSPSSLPSAPSFSPSCFGTADEYRTCVSPPIQIPVDVFTRHSIPSPFCSSSVRPSFLNSSSSTSCSLAFCLPVLRRGSFTRFQWVSAPSSTIPHACPAQSLRYLGSHRRISWTFLGSSSHVFSSPSTRCE
ncbi:hypothetical protein BLNAU_20738 [Blattamonas nauphoetae]|uniref:Uncharacterized protein n=1 Tax=Blattamonas nauphoetae TaxID=2049346 RepID=A0ABQ9WXU7_9EUKA|nr:hypothetical protein BLNAU_20738 [Blattamonas nauphoetae]